MYREVIHKLLDWKDQKKRKPLIINGARQVGKSWIVEQFGKRHYLGRVHVINFEKRGDIHAIFDNDFDVNRILMELELSLNTNIEKGTDLVFFDEIQTCPRALASLRYFYEDMPQIHLIAAGSLLDFEFRNIPYPVGRVQTLDMYPMTFYEFLIAKGKAGLAKILKEPFVSLAQVAESLMINELQQYMIVGGMPECVVNYLAHQNMSKVHQLQDELLFSFSQDFKKYHPTVNDDCLNDILLNSAKMTGGQIIYTKLSDRFSNPTVKKGVDVLIKARLLSKVSNVSIAGLPLTPTGKRFKLFHLDIGLLIRKSKLGYEEYFHSKNLLAGFKGALAEQFVAQQIIANQTDSLHYWARTKPSSTAEIDFIIVRNSKIIPIEVKSGKTGSLKSLHLLLDKFDDIEKAYVLSSSRLGSIGKVQFIPIYYAGQL